MTQRRDRGSATVLAVGLVGALASLGVAAVVLAGAVIASHRARSAADLAALAGASRVLRGEPAEQACMVATAVARDNEARLLRCEAEGSSLRVVVAVRPAIPGLGSATARARAGPPRPWRD